MHNHVADCNSAEAPGASRTEAESTALNDDDTCPRCVAAGIGVRFVNSEAFQAHMRWMRLRGLSADTIAQRTGVLRRLAAWCGNRPLLEITEAELTEWGDDLASRLAVATRAVYVSNVREFYAWCYKEHRIAADPAANLPVPRVPARKPRPITEGELVLAIESGGVRVRCWLVLAGWCGLRAREIAYLRAENIRWNDDPPYLLVTQGKGGKERIVPLPEYALTELRQFPMPSRGLIWKTADGRPVPPNLVSVICNRHLHALGIQDTLHSLRHRFGTQVQRAVRDLRVTQELMGHTTPATTAGYAAVADLDKYKAVAALPVPAPRTAVRLYGSHSECKADANSEYRSEHTWLGQWLHAADAFNCVNERQ